jgi:co-chaperonin GroES (HSP10)
MMQGIDSIRLLGARILVKPDAVEDRIGSIWIPDNAKKPTGTGVVVAMGPGMLCKDGTRWPMPEGLAVGDRVVFSKDAKAVPQLVEIDGEKYQRMYDDDVVAVLETECATCKGAGCTRCKNSGLESQTQWGPDGKPHEPPL